MYWYDVFHDFAVPIATVLAAGAAVLVTHRLGSRQVEIARQQTVTAQQQAATAKQQADTALDRLRYDLFDKRYKIYEAVKELIVDVVRNHPGGGLRPFDMRPKLLIIDEARFFFPKETCELLERIVDDCWKVMAIHGERNITDSDSPQWLILSEQAVAGVKKLDKIRLDMPELFEGALSFSQLTRPS